MKKLLLNEKLANLLTRGTIETVEDYQLFKENADRLETSEYGEYKITDIRINLNTACWCEIYEAEEDARMNIRFYCEDEEFETFEQLKNHLLENFENDFEDKKDEIFEECFQAILSSINNFYCEYHVYVDVDVNSFKITKIWTGEETNWTGYCGYTEDETYKEIYTAKGTMFEDDLSQYEELNDEENLKAFCEDWLYSMLDDRLEEIKSELKQEYLIFTF